MSTLAFKKTKFWWVKSLNFNSNDTVCLTECKQYGKQDIGSSKTKFCKRENNYKSTHCKLRKKQVSKEALKLWIFREHFYPAQWHNVVQAWVITLIEQVSVKEFLIQEEFFWAHKLHPFSDWHKSKENLPRLLITWIIFYSGEGVFVHFDTRWGW